MESFTLAFQWSRMVDEAVQPAIRTDQIADPCTSSAHGSNTFDTQAGGPGKPLE